jgi:cytochrome P450
MSDSTPFDDLPYLDVFSEAYASDPYALIAQARMLSPVARSDRGIEFLSHATAERLLTDRRLNTGMPMLMDQNGISDGPLWNLMVLSMLGAEGDLHRRLRNAVMPYFNAGAAARMRLASRAYVSAWLGETAEAGECDFATVVGRRLPATLFCDMIGAPAEDWEFIADVSEGMLKLFTFQPGAGDLAIAALHDGHAYLAELIEARRRAPGEDLISAMVTASGEDKVSDLEVMDLALTILGGSTDNTRSQMSLNLITLAELPDVWRALKRDRSLVATAVVEATRYRPGQLSGFRVPNEEIEVDGLTLTPEHVVHTNNYAANRDPAAYPDPDRFDIARKQGAPLNFGHGRHFCIGRPIAQVEMEEALNVALDLWSEFEIGDTDIWGAPFSLRTDRVSIHFELDRQALASTPN